MGRFSALVVMMVGLVAPSALGAGALEWEQIGPEGGVVWRLASDPAELDHLFAASSEGVRLHISTDGGSTWRCGGEGLETAGFLSAVAASGATVYVASERSGVLRSDDGGLRFAATGGPAPGPVRDVEIGRAAGAPSGVAPVWAATDGGGIFRSVDEGATWESRNDGLTNLRVFDLALDPTDPAILYAATSDANEGGVFRSIDGGASWSLARDGMAATLVFQVLVDPLTPSTVYAAGAVFNVVSTSWQVYRSADSAVTWERIDADLPAFFVPTLETDGTYLWVADWNVDEVYRSADGGRTWESGTSISPVTAVFDLQGVPGHGLFAAAAGPGLSRSLDGGLTWHRATTGLRAEVVQALAIDPLHPEGIYAGTGVGGLVHSLDGGDSWQILAEGLSAFNVFGVAVAPSEPPILWLATAGGGIFRSTDGGQAWSPANQGLADLTVLDLERSDGVLWAGTASGVFQSFDGATSWQDASQGLGGAWVNDLTVSATIAWAATRQGLFRSLDGGRSWSAPPSPFAGETTWAVVTDPADFSRVWVAVGERVYRSLNGGTDWAADDLGLDGGVVWSLHLDPASDRLLAGTERGIFERLAGGWVRSPTPIPPVSVEAFASTADGLVLAGTSGGSILRANAAAILFSDGFESGNTSRWSTAER